MRDTLDALLSLELDFSFPGLDSSLAMVRQLSAQAPRPYELQPESDAVIEAPETTGAGDEMQE